MNPSFKLKYDEMRDNQEMDEAVESVHKYDSAGQSRNVCFVFKTGDRLFLNYGYLVSGEYLVAENKIILTFTSHLVTLEGIILDELFNDLMHHSPKQIIETDGRYNHLNKEEETSRINKIEVSK